MTRREERIVENIVQISQAWSRLREAGQKLKTALDPWFVLFSKGGCDDELYKRRDGKRHHGQLHLTDEEKSLIFAREIVEYRKKICWMEADLNDLCLYKVEMIKRIVGLQVLLKDVKEDFREKKEHEYMEKKALGLRIFREATG